jgi:outer membrane murein-binding lipoprotein Lpp
MTQAELNFFTRMPNLLNELVTQIKKLNEKVDALTNEVKELKKED